MYVVAALYHFAALPDFAEQRAALLRLCVDLGVTGTLLLAREGINGTIAGRREAIDEVLASLRSDPRLATLEHKESLSETQPFRRMKVKLKREIVTMGVDGIDPNRLVGTYVEPEDWNVLLADPEVVLVDTRNDYEVELGLFEGARDPKTRSFREFPDYVRANLDPKRDRKVAMYCTGGIRCEKATAYLLEQGFEQVFHLKGGILNYLERVPEQDSRWRGECYVFDDRVTVDHRLQPGHYALCHACGMPVSEADRRAETYEVGVSCPRCHDRLTPEQRVRFSERMRQKRLAQARGEHEHD